MISSITYRPIGIIHSPFREPRGTAIQPGSGKDIEGTAEVHEEFAEGLKDLDIVDGTPLLDLKPHISGFDAGSTERIGWLEENIHKLRKTRDNGRFLNGSE